MSLSWGSQKELVRAVWRDEKVRDALRSVLSPTHFEREDLGWILKLLFLGKVDGTPLTSNELRERWQTAAPHIVSACESLLPQIEGAETLETGRAIESGRRFAAEQEATIFAGQLVSMVRSGQWSEIRNKTEELFRTASTEALAEDDLLVVKASQVSAERVAWLWEGFIPIGKVCTVEGDPGLGKSTTILDVAARVTRGFAAPTDDALTQGSSPYDVVIMSGEDNAGDTIRPRLEAAGADLDRVHLIQGVREKNNGEATERGIALDRDVLRIENLVIKTGAKLVIIDPIVAMLGGTVDFHRDQDVRRVLSALARMAERRKCAVVTIRHMNKDKDVKTILYRGGGSIGFVAAVRVAMLVVKHPTVEDDRVIAVYKTNLSRPPQPVIFRFQDVPELKIAKIEWVGRSNRTVNELIQGGSSE